MIRSTLFLLVAVYLIAPFALAQSNTTNNTIVVVAPNNTNPVVAPNNTNPVVAPNNTNSTNSTIPVVTPNNTNSTNSTIPVVAPNNTNSTIPVVTPNNTNSTNNTIPVVSPNTNSTNNTNNTNPIAGLTTVVIDVHFVSGNINDQFLAWHYCTTARSGVIQCALFDSAQPDAKFIGIEDVITADVFNNLSTTEQQLWYSNNFQIQNGLFIIPGMSGDAENAVLQTLANSYGKSFSIWDQGDSQPIGIPRLTYGLGLASQINTTVAAQVDAIASDGLNYTQRAASRVNLTFSPVNNQSSRYLVSGQAIQYEKYLISVDADGEMK